MLPDYSYTASDEDVRVVAEAELVKHMLNFCYTQHGATITITVEHDNGHKATAKLYDHEALIQSLYDALETFQSEI
jgi:hypothetical protein